VAVPAAIYRFFDGEPMALLEWQGDYAGGQAAGSVAGIAGVDGRAAGGVLRVSADQHGAGVYGERIVGSVDLCGAEPEGAAVGDAVARDELGTSALRAVLDAPRGRASHDIQVPLAERYWRLWRCEVCGDSSLCSE
jgi:hypothetical protein